MMIKFYYIGVPVCMIIQAIIMMWTGWMVTKIACKRRRKRHEIKQEGEG